MDEKKRLDTMYRDLEAKAALDADATVGLLEALTAVFAGREPDEAMAGFPGQAATGMTPLALAREAAALRGLAGGRPDMSSLIALRDSLYRYQSYVEQR
ncbi:MAG TPA: hypothetical protein VN521_01970 [Negativicutes bacterium]|nr:hypothetical protein [Negativicutes bacterium]